MPPDPEALEVGLGYKLARVHIGSCDFSLGNWTSALALEGCRPLLQVWIGVLACRLLCV